MTETSGYFLPPPIVFTIALRRSALAGNSHHTVSQLKCYSRRWVNRASRAASQKGAEVTQSSHRLESRHRLPVYSSKNCRVASPSPKGLGPSSGSSAIIQPSGSSDTLQGPRGLRLTLPRQGGIIPLDTVQHHLICLTQAQETLRILLRVVFLGFPDVGPLDGRPVPGELLHPLITEFRLKHIAFIHR